MAQETRVFENVDRTKVDHLRSSLAAFVTLPEGDRGELSKSGFSGTFDYDETAQRLSLTISEVPVFVPRAMVWSTIERALS
jgi:hypothetical protein